MDKRTLSICVFCGSSHGSKPEYGSTARALGKLIGGRGHSLVFGGGGVGLMGETADAVTASGGTVVGILPRFLRYAEPPPGSIDELIITPDMQERKARMLSLADAFVVLPGGLGTLDEIFEVLSTAQLKVHAKPIVLVNINGHFDILLTLLKHVVRDGFARPEIETHFKVVTSAEEAIDYVEEKSGPKASKGA
jgi:uncharacterized protein (TIGR00730 family)